MTHPPIPEGRDLVAGLNARLDEVQARAEAAIPEGGTGDWEWDCRHESMTVKPPSHDLCARVGFPDGEMTLYDEGGHTPEQAAHIVFWDPATVLRMVAATRKLLELHKEEMLHGRPQGVCESCDPEGTTHFKGWPCPSLKIEAERWGCTDDSETRTGCD